MDWKPITELRSIIACITLTVCKGIWLAEAALSEYNLKQRSSEISHWNMMASQRAPPVPLNNK